MTSPLFRPEVMQARAGHWLGGVRLNTSLPWWGLTAGAALLASTLLAYAFIGEVTRKAQVSGILVPSGGQMDLHAAAAGRVAELRAAEGQTVRQGDVVMVLALDRATGAGDVGAQVALQIDSRRAAMEAERTLRSAQVRLQQQSLAARVQAMDAELRRADDEISLANRRLALAQQQAARVDQLLTAGFLSANQAQVQQQELIEAETRVQQLTRTRIALARDRATLAAEGAQLAAQLQTELAQVDRAVAALAQEAAENDARRTQVITAPGDGTVTLLAIAPGQPVMTGQLVGSLVPAGALIQAHLFAPSRTAGMVKPGQTVRLRYAAFPYQKFGLQLGEVAAISQTPIAPNQFPPALQHLATPSGAGEGLYRITVSLREQAIGAYGAKEFLKAGMTLQADVMQERRRIVEWALEPLIATSMRLQ
ncbi:MAG: HlyD family efflux transporter periplasmic adaptor subunit [Burkholderiaceae bacterium]|nr:HlyD family efflux transporter periplasmic adaptor subunit [Burkholderiaceae bacterium]